MEKWFSPKFQKWSGTFCDVIFRASWIFSLGCGNKTFVYWLYRSVKYRVYLDFILVYFITTKMPFAHIAHLSSPEQFYSTITLLPNRSNLKFIINNNVIYMLFPYCLFLLLCKYCIWILLIIFSVNTLSNRSTCITCLSI